jgi:hypothetical protein
MRKNEMKQKQNEKEAKTSKQKRIKWNSGTICKESKKILRLVFYFFMSIPSMISFRSKTKQKTFILFRFEAKRKDWKRNEQFLEAKQSANMLDLFRFGRKRKIWRKKRIFFYVSVRNACETDLVLLWSEKFFLAKPAHPSPGNAPTLTMEPGSLVSDVLLQFCRFLSEIAKKQRFLQIAKQNCRKAKVSADFEAKLFKFRVTTEDVLYCSVWQEWQLKPCSSFITYTQLYIQPGSADKRTVLSSAWRSAQRVCIPVL